MHSPEELKQRYLSWIRCRQTGPITAENVAEHFGDFSEGELDELTGNVSRFGEDVRGRVDKGGAVVRGRERTVAEMKRATSVAAEDVRLLAALAEGAKGRLRQTGCGWLRALAWACQNWQKLVEEG
jgi:hypothetical protein